MCGVAGIIGFEKQAAEDCLSRAINAMTHRGPNANQCFQEGRIRLGHRRLPIIDLSTFANQPFIDASGRYVVVFNGEIYDFLEVKQLLLQEYPFSTKSDTEVIVAAFAKWGIGCIEYLKGMFAIAIWDRQMKKLTLVRDRFGVKPLYYYINDHYLIFASQIRALLATGLVPKQISEDGLYEVLSYQSLTAPLSIVNNVFQLQAGHYLELNGKAVNTWQYFNVFDETVDVAGEDKAAIQSNIRKLLRESVKRRLISDVPIGAFLSGGIDSSAVVALMAETMDGSPNTFNISFHEKEYDESSYAELVATKCNTNHTSIRLSANHFLNELRPALKAMDSPSGDGINTYVVSKAIRQAGITVALSGLGGDELFAGYPIFSQFSRLQRYKNTWGPTYLLRKLATTLYGNGTIRKERINSILNAPSLDIESIYPISRQIISKKHIVRLTNLDERNTVLENNFQIRVQHFIIFQH